MYFELFLNFRLSDGRPIPPPKPTQLQAKPWPPAPDSCNSNTLLDPDSFKSNQNVISGQNVPSYHSRSYPTSPNKPPPPPKRKDPSYYKKQYQENSDISAMDTMERPNMGHSYSQDNVYSPNRAYSNVMFKDQRQIPYSPPQSPPLPPPVGLDLSSRESRGSAFELYKKADTHNHQDSLQSNQR